jgi:hypothetical protein
MMYLIGNNRLYNERPRSWVIDLKIFRHDSLSYDQKQMTAGARLIA